MLQGQPPPRAWEVVQSAAQMCMCTGQQEMLTRLSVHSCGSVSCLICEPRSVLGEGKNNPGFQVSALMRQQHAGPLESARTLRPRARSSLLKCPRAPVVAKLSKLVAV